MGNVLVWSDHGKNRRRLAEAMDEIQDINPTLDWNQAKDNLDRGLLTKAHADGKSKRINLKVQVTTTERTDITYQ